ncbi:MAG: PIN domain-containing protein [Candidatus Rokuibacteriota bacterium]
MRRSAESGPQRGDTQVPAFLPDTSCILAALCSWHVDHEPAAREIQARLGRAHAMFVGAPSLVEAYSVLTRFPPPHRLGPSDALLLLETSFISAGTVVALDAGHYVRLLREAARDGVAGGRIYDAVIAACVERSNGVTLLTFNVSDFESLARPGLEVITPGAT